MILYYALLLLFILLWSVLNYEERDFLKRVFEKTTPSLHSLINSAVTLRF
jgi:hypothetical protein